MTLRLPLLLILIGLPFYAAAHNLIDGQHVAPVGVVNKGERILRQGEPDYRSWNSARLDGKAGVVLHMAGRLSAKALNAPLIQAIADARFPAQTFRITTIVNTDEAIPGSAIFVRRSLESSKQETPAVQFVVDELGAVRRTWQLEAGGSAVVVLDKQGRVRFAKDGALTQSEVQQVIALIRQLLA
jgi:YtfJ family uncharacterized protein